MLVSSFVDAAVLSQISNGYGRVRDGLWQGSVGDDSCEKALGQWRKVSITVRLVRALCPAPPSLVPPFLSFPALSFPPIPSLPGLQALLLPIDAYHV